MNWQDSDHIHSRYERFVVVGHARTGSNLLSVGLRTSKYVYMLDEIFAAHKRKHGEDYDQIIRSLFTQLPLHVTHVGFKLFYYHLNGEEWKKFFNGDQFKVIHLTRRNYLRTAISLEIASITGQWVNLKTDKKNIDKAIEVDPEQILKRIKYIAEQERWFRAVVKDWKSLEVVYEDLTKDLKKEFKRIYSFLKIPEIRFLKIRLKKQNPEPLNKLIKNFDEVARFLRQTEFSKCIE